MTTVTEAETIIHINLPVWGETRVNAENPVVAQIKESICADRAYPPFDRATMDGICLSYDHYVSGAREFKIDGICGAGSPRMELSDHKNCLEIMTGAPVPFDADLIIPYENLRVENGIAQVVTAQNFSKFENIHRLGSDCQAGAEILSAGAMMNGPRWGIAASFGITSIAAARIPKIKIVATGNELVPLSKTPMEYQLRMSNGYALKACLLHNGYYDVEVDHVSDDFEEISEHFIRNVERFDVLIYSGGVSKGKFDYLPDVWKKHEVRQLLHGVSQRPGKPLWFGTYRAEKTTAIFGLPGNPVSSLICLRRYFIRRPKMCARLTEHVTFEKQLTYFAPVKVHMEADGVLMATPLTMKNSGEFTALANSDGFIELDAAASVFKKGESFPFYGWGPL